MTTPLLSQEPAARPIRVLVVDDSVVIRRVVSRILSEDRLFEVIGFASNGSEALKQEELMHPDVITMDIEMPGKDGLSATRDLRARGSKVIIIMCSALTTRGASSTIDALMHGANDYVTKASGEAQAVAFDDLRRELPSKIKQFFPSHTRKASAATPIASGPRITLPAMERRQRQVLAIGVSTGGPTALMALLPRFPADFPLPIVIVQHMPPVFTGQLAARLNTQCALEVLEGTEGLELQPGRAILAPGDFHMRLKRISNQVVISLDQGERENSCRPAVDILFASVSQTYGGCSIGVVLTGMGQDGLRGVQYLRDCGGYIIAQDKASSVVWGMPGAVVDAGLADSVVGLDQVAATVFAQVPSR